MYKKTDKQRNMYWGLKKHVKQHMMQMLRHLVVEQH